MFPGLIRTFHEVAKAGSLRRAGDIMGVSPSSVSRQVAILERQMGTQLIERSAGGIALTHAGELVAGFSRNVVMEFDGLKVDLDDIRGVRRREIRIAAVESTVATAATVAIANFRRKFDQVSFRLTMMPALGVMEAVRKDHCDVGITQSPEADADVISIARSPEPVVLAVRDDHPLAGRKTVSVEEVCEMNVAVPDENFGIRRMFNNAVFARNLIFTPALVANSFEALRDFVRRSGDCAILPLRAAAGSRSVPLVAVSIEEKSLQSGEVHIVTHRDRKLPNTTKLFVKELLSQLS